MRSVYLCINIRANTVRPPYLNRNALHYVKLSKSFLLSVGAEIAVRADRRFVMQNSLFFPEVVHAYAEREKEWIESKKYNQISTVTHFTM